MIQIVHYRSSQLHLILNLSYPVLSLSTGLWSASAIATMSNPRSLFLLSSKITLICTLSATEFCAASDFPPFDQYGGDVLVRFFAVSPLQTYDHDRITVTSSTS